MEQTQKRLFFGFEVEAPWPETLPQGRVLKEKNRHLTLAFLGNCDYPRDYSRLLEQLQAFPTPSFKVGFVGKFDQCLFFPLKRPPRVVAWHVDFLEENSLLIRFQKTLNDWLRMGGFHPSTHSNFNPHVTLARAPFNRRVWEKAFTPLPLQLKNINLYESKGGLHYEPIWNYPLLAPFEEISHAADVAYWIRGENFDQLYRHAGVALATTFPRMLPYLRKQNGIHSLDDVIIALNGLVSTADQEVGCPFKAVSFHSYLEEREGILQWEMIIDV